jgi:DNA-binding HxlR family transcriptional regulator
VPQNGDILYTIEGMKGCPLDNTSRIIGKKFTLLILRNMMSNQNKFNQFIESIEGLNPKTLSARLKEIEKNGLRIEYYLTENLYLIRWLDFLLSIVLKMYSRMENPEP